MIDVLFRRSTDYGATWKLVKSLSNNAGTSLSPQVVARGVVLPYDILERRSDDNGSTWKPTKNLASNTGESDLPQIDG